MSGMSLVGPYLTTTRYGKSRRKLPNTASLRESTAKHDAWLKKQGLHPSQRELKKAFTGKFKYDMPDYAIEDTAPLSNNLHVDGGRKTGVLANLHKEKPEVQKEILDKANRTAVAYNKGPVMYVTPETDVTTLGSKSRRG